MSDIEISKATEADFPAICEIFRKVTETGDTYVYPAGMSDESIRRAWMADLTYVASLDGRAVGTYILKPNQPGRGSHIANGSFMVHPECRGHGVGRVMGYHAIDKARENSFRAMQFNMVIATNRPAVRLWRSLGFQVIGTVPQGFRHKELGYVDVLVMFRFL